MKTPSAPPSPLMRQGWGDPESRSVILDWYEQQGADAARTMRAFWFIYAAADAADADAADAADADAADAADADADAADAADADADAADAADADADAADAADADAAADAAAAADAIKRSQPLEVDMTPGLKIIQISITNYRAITFVGWLRRLYGDEFELLPGARIITKKPGLAWDWNGIDNLAAGGLGKDYQVTPPMKMREELHRLGNIRRSKPANEESWRPHVPRPADWSDE